MQPWRAAGAYACARDGYDIGTVQELLGHRGLRAMSPAS